MRKKQKRNEYGGMAYCPKSLLEEMETVRQEQGIFSKSEAFRKVSDYARMGRLASIADAIDYDKMKRVFPPMSTKLKRNKGVFGGGA